MRPESIAYDYIELGRIPILLPFVFGLRSTNMINLSELENPKELNLLKRQETANQRRFSKIFANMVEASTQQTDVEDRLEEIKLTDSLLCIHSAYFF